MAMLCGNHDEHGLGIVVLRSVLHFPFLRGGGLCKYKQLAATPEALQQVAAPAPDVLCQQLLQQRRRARPQRRRPAARGGPRPAPGTSRAAAPPAPVPAGEAARPCREIPSPTPATPAVAAACSANRTLRGLELPAVCWGAQSSLVRWLRMQAYVMLGLDV